LIPRSLESRLALQQQILAVAVVGAFAVSALGITRATLARQETQTLESAATRVAMSLDLEFAEEHDLGKAIDAVLREEADEGVRITIADLRGRALANFPRTRDSLSAIPQRGEHQVRVAARCGVWVEVAMSDRLAKASLAALARALLIAALPLLLITFFLSRWTARRALRPLQEMTERAGELSLDDEEQSLGGTRGLAELERLRVAFDRLLSRLSDQLRAERQFASDASHELRTPLTVLTGEIELAGSREGLDPATRENLAHASVQVRAMRELVESLMLLRRASEGPAAVRQAFEAVDLSDVVEVAAREVVARYSDRRDDLTLVTELDVLVSGHPGLLVAAVRNLLDNAFKFTPPDTEVRAIAAQDEHWASVCVEDGGRGIPDSDRERVFDPFFRGTEARAESSGFGLGLPILRRIARAHGGDVTIGHSSLGGARITLLLPRWRSLDADRTPSRGQSAAGDHRGSDGRMPRSSGTVTNR
jgi:two-component system OmpR family sensor kinase